MKQSRISGARKAAILLVLMGDDASAGIFRYMQEDEIQEISREISRLGEINPKVADSLIEEFYRLSLAHSLLARGGPEFAKKLLVKAFGNESSKKLMDYLDISLQKEPAGFNSLQKADPVQLSKVIQSEQPQTITLILAQLDSSKAAALLESLPEYLRADVVMRMASLEQVSPDVINKITSILEQKLRSPGNFSREPCGGIRAVADLISRMETKSAGKILEKIEGENPSLAQNIRNLMFVFDDIMLIDDAGMREILQRVDKKTLTIALKGTSKELQEQFFHNMSSRTAEMIKEAMEALGPVKVRDVETSRQQIVGTVLRLDETGVVHLMGGSGDEYIA